MILLDELKSELNSYLPQIKELADVLNIENSKTELEELRNKAAEPGFWDNLENSQMVLQKTKTIENKIASLESLSSQLDDLIALTELCIEEGDEDTAKEITEGLDDFKRKLENEKLATLLTGEYDNSNAILTFHAGAGGTEAQDWAEMLYRMYNRWGESHGFKINLLDYLDGDEAGLKSASILIEGENAYGYLKSEAGVHRLVRVSPFDSSGRRHTSFAAVEVMPEIDDNIEVDIRPEDIKMDVFRASGAGGQHVNKTSSAVRLIHKPTGMIAECQEERSQFQNREKAMRLLASRLYEAEREKRESAYDAERRSQVGSGDRSQRIRTYNFPQSRVTDHRIGLTLYKIDAIMDGALDELIDALVTADQAEKLKQGQEAE